MVKALNLWFGDTLLRVGYLPATGQTARFRREPSKPNDVCYYVRIGKIIFFGWKPTKIPRKRRINGSSQL